MLFTAMPADHFPSGSCNAKSDRAPSLMWIEFRCCSALFAGAKSQVLSSPDVSGPRRATSPDMEAANSMPLAETSTSLPESLTSKGSALHSQDAPHSGGAATLVNGEVSEFSAHNDNVYIMALKKRVSPRGLAQMRTGHVNDCLTLFAL
jgi:hypothetical protein